MLTPALTVDNHGNGASGRHVAGGITGYRKRTFAFLRTVLADVQDIVEAVDVGAGDGWIAQSLMREELVRRCVPVDVVRRARVILEPVIYDGIRLPIEDHSVDLAYAVDAVHHAADPLALLREMVRVSRRWIALKDHTYSNAIGAWTLRTLDEIGNRRFSIGSPGHYQYRFEWIDMLRDAGFTVRHMVHPARVHTGMLGATTNHLQFVALLERIK